MSGKAGNHSGQILVLVDDSPGSRSAVRIATEVARALGRPLALLGASSDAGQASTIAGALSDAQAHAKARVASLETVQATGELLETAKRRVSQSPTELVVLGANLRPADPSRVLAGRIWRIVKALSPPVLVVPAGCETLKRFLFCTGGERFIEGGATLAAAIAGGLQAEVIVFHVSPHAPAMYGARFDRESESATEFLGTNSRVSRNVRRQIEIFQSAGARTSFRVAGGDVVPQVLEEIRREKPDLVVVGSVPTRGVMQTYVLGDLTREIVARARRPFLVLRSKAPGFWSELWGALRDGSSRETGPRQDAGDE
jgi:nucleotide-binding universal stress UspA family protein